MSIDLELMAQELRRDEDVRRTIYTCSAGAPTVGVGHNLNNPLSDRAIEVILQDDIAQTLADCERLDYFHALSPVRKRVIMNMMFNLGATRLSGFVKMVAAIKQEDWLEAAIQMTDSKWFNQTGNRAVRLCEMMHSDSV